jgi:hypothetical protein
MVDVKGFTKIFDSNSLDPDTDADADADADPVTVDPVTVTVDDDAVDDTDAKPIFILFICSSYTINSLITSCMSVYRSKEIIFTKF